MTNPSVSFKRREAKTLRFTIKDKDGNVLDVSSTTLTFGVKRIKSDPSFIIQKDNADFDKTQAVDGIVDLPLSADDLDHNKNLYVAELKTYFSGSNIDKSVDIDFLIIEPVIPT
jgi:hypothetical protein